MSVPGLLDLLGLPGVLLEPGVHELYPSSGLPWRGCLGSGGDDVLLVLLALSELLAVEPVHLLHLVVLLHTLLLHHLLRLLLGSFELPLHLHLLPDLGLHDLLGHLGVDSHQSVLLSLELLLGDGETLVVVLLLVLGEPSGEVLMVLEAEPAVAPVDDLLPLPGSEHLLGYGQCLRQTVDIIVLHGLPRHNLDLSVCLLLILLLLQLPILLRHPLLPNLQG